MLKFIIAKRNDFQCIFRTLSNSVILKTVNSLFKLWKPIRCKDIMGSTKSPIYFKHLFIVII